MTSWRLPRAHLGHQGFSQGFLFIYLNSTFLYPATRKGYAAAGLELSTPRTVVKRPWWSHPSIIIANVRVSGPLNHLVVIVAQMTPPPQSICILEIAKYFMQCIQLTPLDMLQDKTHIKMGFVND